MNSLHLELRRQFMKGVQLGLVGLCGCPCRKENLHPALGLEGAQDLQSVLFVTDLLQLLPAVVSGEKLDDVLAFGVVVAGLGSGSISQSRRAR